MSDKNSESKTVKLELSLSKRVFDMYHQVLFYCDRDPEKTIEQMFLAWVRVTKGRCVKNTERLIPSEDITYVVDEASYSIIEEGCKRLHEKKQTESKEIQNETD